jgi:CD109 antigen
VYLFLVVYAPGVGIYLYKGTYYCPFVVKSFAQAKQYIFIDDKLVLKALDWLVLQQDEIIGTFKEPGKVLHKAMQV